MALPLGQKILGHVPVRCTRIAGATLDPCVDVAVQQQLCASALCGLRGPQSSDPCCWPVASADDNPGLLLGVPVLWGGVEFQWSPHRRHRRDH